MQCTWQDFFADIIPYVSSPDERFKRTPDRVILHNLKRASHEFLLRSALCRDVYCADAQCGVCEVPFILPEGRTLNKIHKVVHKQHCETGTPYRYSFNGEDTITLHVAPHEDEYDAICAHYSYVPDIRDCEPPEKLCDYEYRDAIVSLTLMYLYGMPRMDWASPRDAQIQERRANSLIARARKRAANRSGSKTTQRISKQMGDLFWDT